MNNYQEVSAYHAVAYANGRKVKDVDIVKQNNNGIMRQIVHDNMSATRRRQNKHVRFSNAVSKPTRSGIRRMPTPYFTRNNRKVKSLRKYGKNRK
jgi:hypothetical protein